MDDSFDYQILNLTQSFFDDYPGFINIQPYSIFIKNWELPSLQQGNFEFRQLWAKKEWEITAG